MKAETWKATHRWPIPPASNDPVKVAAELLLAEQGYSADEARLGIHLYQDGMPVSRAQIRSLVRAARDHIRHVRDDLCVGTDLYTGIAYFWAYKYRFWMRGDAHGNGYRGIPVKRARRIIHRRFLDEGLSLNGETPRHDEIINEVFGGGCSYADHDD